MGRGARGGGGLRAGPGAVAWLRGVRFWRGLARIHSVNRELETVWPDGFQLRLTPTSASAAHENPCWHGFAPHLGHSGATAWLPKRDRASAGTRFRHSGPRPNAAGLLRTSTGKQMATTRAIGPQPPGEGHRFSKKTIKNKKIGRCAGLLRERNFFLLIINRDP